MAALDSINTVVFPRMRTRMVPAGVLRMLTFNLLICVGTVFTVPTQIARYQHAQVLVELSEVC